MRTSDPPPKRAAVEPLKSAADEAARLADLMAAPAIEALLTAGLLTPDNIEKLRRTDWANYRRVPALQGRASDAR